MPISTSNHPKALWPGVKTWWGKVYDEHPEEWSKIFDKETSTQNYEEDVLSTAFGLAPVKTQGGSISFVTDSQGFTTRYTNVTYALGYIVTMEELQDNLYEKVSKKRAGALAFSFRQTKENVAAQLLNRAFNSSYTFGDGQQLIDTDHPDGTGGTFSNQLSVAADLSEASIEDLVIQMMGAVDSAGNRIPVRPKCLIVPRQEWFNAKRILGNPARPETANRDINVLYAENIIPEIVLNHYLTDTDAWFIKSDVRNGLKMYQRMAISFEQDNDFDTRNAKAASVERYSFGSTDPRGIWGSAGG